MILWTIQDYPAYEIFMDSGILIANEDFVFGKELYDPAYKWLFEQMVERIGVPPQGVKYPVWAWYQWEGKRKKLDMRQSGYAERGTKIVRLTIDVNPEMILLSDFDLYHFPLNYWYLSLTENEDMAFEEEYKRYDFAFEDLQDANINTSEMLMLRNKIMKSWERIFDFELEANDWVVEPMERKSIQATMWYVKKEQLVNAEVFIAR